ncbi:MAG: hypothetical protein LBO63_00525 [Oscillospiraceae bacterium]|nr:hypothetical protein [Oscillospiraceae bacterium]
MFVIAAKLRLTAQQSAYAAGGYFFRFAGKSNQKGATSLEEAILFLYGNCGGGKADCAFPRNVSRWLWRTLALRRTQGRSLSRGWVTSVRLQLAANCRRVPTGRMLLLRLLPRACAAIGCVSRRSGCCCGNQHACTVRLRAPLPQGFALVGDDALIVPPFGSHRHLCKSTAPAQRGCVGCVRLPPCFARRDTRVVARRNSAGRGAGVLRQIPVGTRRR